MTDPQFDSGRCPEKDENGICTNKDAKGRPCWVDAGREDMCPRTVGFQADKAAQEADAGER
jgi:hypothetical protein